MTVGSYAETSFGTLATHVGFSVQSFSVDRQGAVAWTPWIAVGASTPRAGVGGVLTVTSAESVRDLQGTSWNTGGERLIGPVNVGPQSVVPWTGDYVGVQIAGSGGISPPAGLKHEAVHTWSVVLFDPAWFRR